MKLFGIISAFLMVSSAMARKSCSAAPSYASVAANSCTENCVVVLAECSAAIYEAYKTGNLAPILSCTSMDCLCHCGEELPVVGSWVKSICGLQVEEQKRLKVINRDNLLGSDCGCSNTCVGICISGHCQGICA
jgi:hypothetical protein